MKDMQQLTLIWQNALHSIQTVMRRSGVPQDILDQWVAKCNTGEVQYCERGTYLKFILESTELDSLKIHSWVRLRMLWGQRNSVPAPVSSTPDASTGVPTYTGTTKIQPSTWRPHPQVHIYHSAEESLQARKARLDAMGELAEPLTLAE